MLCSANVFIAANWKAGVTTWLLADWFWFYCCTYMSAISAWGGYIGLEQQGCIDSMFKKAYSWTISKQAYNFINMLDKADSLFFVNVYLMDVVCIVSCLRKVHTHLRLWDQEDIHSLPRSKYQLTQKSFICRLCIILNKYCEIEVQFWI